MTAQPIATPDITSTEQAGYPRAPWGKRLCAFIIDSLIAGLLTTMLFALLLYVMVMALTYQQLPFLENASEVTFYIYIAVTILSIIWLSIYSLARDGVYKGQSVGKLICGLMVVYVERDQPCNLGGSILRNLPGLLAVLISGPVVYCSFLLLPIEPIAALVDGLGRRLGDRWAKTQVIEKKHFQNHP